MSNLIKALLLILTLPMLIFFFSWSNVGLASAISDKPLYTTVKGRVIDSSIQEKGSEAGGTGQLVTVRILSGEYSGNIIQLNNSLLINPWPNIQLKDGDWVVLTLEEREGRITNAYISDYGRSNSIYILIGSYFLLLIMIGGRKGVKAIVALSITCLVLILILLPLLLKGHNPLFLTIIILAVITLITMPIIGGLNIKTWSATLGTICGVIIAGVIAFSVGTIFHLTGFIDDGAQDLLFIHGLGTLDLKGLLFAGMIIGALGATMDVGMSIASSIEEVKRANPRLSIIKLFQAGMNVGRDTMGTMANTLILAYVGSSLPMLLLLIASETSGIRISNSEFVATEVVRALSGSIGLTFTIPITSLISAVFQSKKAAI